MNTRIIRGVVVVATSFLAITAVVGGIALFLGINTPSVAILEGSPFPTFELPGLALLFVVGGSAWFASVLTLRRHHYATRACLLAGGIIICFEVVEILVIGSPPGVARNLQIFYILLGLTIALLALVQYRGDRRK
jgi:hypothetical protein